MGFKRGVIIGFAGGYVLGARAGRERYEQIVTLWNRVGGSPKVQQLTDKGKEMAGEAGRKSLYAVQQGVQKASSAVKDRLGNNGEAFETGEASL